MGKYLLGLDAGNTVVKAVLFDMQGNELAMAALDGKSSHPQPGYVERDMVEMWSQAATVIRQCVEKAKISPADILGIGCSGHGNGLYMLDGEQQPLLAIQSLDSRAMGLVDQWRDEGVGEVVYPLCLQKPWPSQTPTLLAWAKRNRPDLYGRLGTVFMCKDYVAFKLTGLLGSDYSDMSGAGLLNMASRNYDMQLMAAYGLADAFDALPPLREPYEVVGPLAEFAARETGLVAGIPVVAGLFDVIASALGSGVADQGSASIVAGTWSINQVVRDKAIADDRIFMWSDFGPGLAMAIESSATSAANLEWFVKEFVEPGHDHEAGGSPFDLCNDLVAGVTPAPGLPIYHPYLYGSSDNGAARAGFYGLGGWHGRAEMLYALYEGVAFGHRNHIENLRAAGCFVDNGILSGGGARSTVWPQIFADVLNLPLSVARCRETGALGAAIAAAVGVGVFSSYRDGVAAMTRLQRHYRPDETRQSLYDQRYGLFTSVTGAMTAIWDRMNVAGR